MGFFSKLDKREKIAVIIGQLLFFGIIYWIYNNFDEFRYLVVTILVFTLPMLLWIFILYRAMRKLQDPLYDLGLRPFMFEVEWLKSKRGTPDDLLSYLLGAICSTIILIVYYVLLWSTDLIIRY